MRYAIFGIFLFLIGCVPVLAQRLRFQPMHHELALLPVGMGHVQALQVGSDWPATPGMVHYRHEGYGLYKYHFNKFQAVRIGIGYETSLTRTVGDWVYNNVENKTTAATFRAGYEHKLPLGRFMLYGGGELVYAPGRSTTVNINEFGQTTAAEPFQQGRIQGFAGIRFFANKYLSFQLENSVYKVLRSPNTGLTANWLQFGVSVHNKKMKKKCGCGKPGT